MKAAILTAARERFAAHGYERTTIRGVASDARSTRQWSGATSTGGVPADDALLVLLRSAVANELAAARIHVVLAARVAPALAAAGGPDLPPGRTALVSAQLLGLAPTRYLLLLPAVAARTPDQIERSMAPAIAATLNPPNPRGVHSIRAMRRGDAVTPRATHSAH